MPLPEGFNHFEHLQSVFARVHNRRVREYFSDVGPEDWDPDISTPRGSVRVAATILDSDNDAMMSMRLWLFYVAIQGGKALWPPLYTTPTDLFQQSVKFQPQATLYFQEDLDEVEEGFAPLYARISFRLLNETSSTYNESKARALANRINAEFGTGNGWRFQKGRVKVSYKSPDQGVNTSCNAITEAEGKDVIRKLLDLQNETLDERLLRITKTDQLPPTLPPTQTIYGRPRRTPRDRPVGFVRFRYAELHLWGLPNAIILVDLTGDRDDLRD